MNADDFARVRTAFEEAVELSEDEREELALARFGGEPELLRELRGMLAGSDDDAFLEPPSARTLADASARAAASPSLAPGTRVEGFELVRPLAEGGMGTVWEARQLNPSRRVALKVLRAVANADVRRRFEEEARILARLTHPGIAKVLASGVLTLDTRAEPRPTFPRSRATAEDPEGVALPWFAMEFVSGAQPITEHVATTGASVERVLELLIALCDAVHHAHLRGIVHRDLKPDNVLVDADDHLKVIDFGIARETNADVRTRTGAVVGTFGYMSPEQIDGRTSDVDLRTDVHALGTLAFELLTGRSPWPTDVALPDLARAITHDDPPPPSSLAPRVPREVDWIVAKAMEKEPKRRYDSAGALAEDLRRLLANEPLAAGPTSAAYRARKFVRRHRALVTAFVLLVLGVLGTGAGLVVALDETEKAEAAKREAEELAARRLALNEYLNRMISSSNPLGPFSTAPMRETTVAEMLDNASATIADAFPGEPTVEAETRILIGITYKDQGRLADAEQHFHAALELLRDAYGDDHTEVLRCRRFLATIAGRLGRVDEALEVLQETVATVRARDELDEAELGQLLGDLAWMLLGVGRFEAAEPYAVEAAELLANVEGQEPSAAITAHNLALVRRGLGDADGALEAYEDALALFRESFGERHAYTGAVLTNLAVLLADLGELERAEATHREAVAILRERVDEHPILADAMRNYASLLHTTGDLAESEALCREAIELYGTLYGEDHPDRATALNNLAFLLFDRGKYDEANATYQEFADHLRAQHGDDFWRVLISETYAAESRASAGEIDEAGETLWELHGRAENLFGAGDDVTQAIVRSMVRTFAAAGDEASEARAQALLAP